jgi:hypothetical protein
LGLGSVIATPFVGDLRRGANGAASGMGIRLGGGTRAARTIDLAANDGDYNTTYRFAS